MRKDQKQLTSNEKKLLAVLLPSKENAQSGQSLANLIGVDKRTITSLVNVLRCKGYLIGSSRHQPYNGYYMISTLSEYWETVNGLSSQRKHTTETLNNLAKGFQDTFGVSLLETQQPRKKVR